MIDAPVRTIQDIIADFLACRPPDEEVLQYYFPPISQARLSFLLEQKSESELTATDSEELESFLRADEFMGMLKTNTRFKDWKTK